MKWFSAKIRMVALVETKGGNHYMDSVYLFKCDYDWDKAFQKALAIGKRQEEEYINIDGEKVKWRLKEIISLDIIQKLSADGTEVYSEPVWLKENDVISFDALFHPEKSEPTQTF
jgi:hypothetical protein